MPGSSQPTAFRALGPITLFTATTTSSGTELWRTDGTAAGTQIVADIWPGPSSSMPRYPTVVQNTLFFAANDGSVGSELWRSDGTAAGTHLVADLEPGPGDSGPSRLTNVGGRLMFEASTTTAGSEPWVSHGTATSTAMIADLVPGAGGSDPDEFVQLGDITLFVADTPGEGRELWRTDGTAAGTSIVGDLVSGFIGSRPSGLVASGDLVFFRALGPWTGSGLINHVWRTDGTTAGTFIIAQSASSSVPRSFVAFRGGLLFRYADAAEGFALFFSDGTIAGTRLVANLGRPIELGTVAGSRFVFFQTDNGIVRTDGTPPGTLLMPFPISESAFPPYPWTLSNGRLLFWAPHFLGFEPWSFDLGATAQPVGSGCGAFGTNATLAATDPVLGATMRISGDGAAPSVPLVLMLATPRAAAVGPCALYLDITTLATLAALVPAGPTWSVDVLLPDIPLLQGRKLALQAVLGPTAGPLGLDLTNAVLLTLGR